MNITNLNVSEIALLSRPQIVSMLIDVLDAIVNEDSIKPQEWLSDGPRGDLHPYVSLAIDIASRWLTRAEGVTECHALFDRYAQQRHVLSFRSSEAEGVITVGYKGRIAY